MKKHHPKAALAWAKQVVAKKIPAGKYHRLACRRFLNDLKRDDLVFDEQAAQRACNFIQALPHVKGKWANKKQLIKLHPSQQFELCNIYGWFDLDGDRRFTEAYVEKPRKNAKSTQAAGIGLYEFCYGDDTGREVYSGATTEQQAWEIYGTARQMVKSFPELRVKSGIQVNAKTMIIEGDFSKFVPMIGKPGDGANVSCALIDEYHEHDSDDLVQTMRQGVGSRDNPLIFKITTAGSNLGGPCYEHRQMCQRLLEGTIENDNIFAIIYHADESDDWDSVETLEKANPMLDVSKNRKRTLAELELARASAKNQNSYKTKHLNMWVGARTAWMNMLRWQRQKRDLNLAGFEGMPCMLAVDLAHKRDVACVAQVFYSEGKYTSFLHSFAPEETEQNQETYLAFATDGCLHLSPGNATDFSAIEDCIEDLAKRFDCRLIGFDPFNGAQMMQRMMDKGLEVIEYGSTVKNMSDPMKELEARVHDDNFFHDGNKAMTWMMGNVTARVDAKDNIFPRKEKPENKIDGPVATIMAVGLWMHNMDHGGLDSFLNSVESR